MKKTIILIFSLILISALFAVPAGAEDMRQYGVFDGEDLLSSYEEQALETKIGELYAQYSYSILIVTTRSFDGKSIIEYADDYYDNSGYGERDGILLLVSENSRDYYFSTGGYGQQVFTDYGIEYLSGKIQPMLSEGDYYGAFEEYLSLSGDFIEEYKNGIPYDTNNKPSDSSDYVTFEIIFVIIAVIVAVIVTAVMKGKMAPPKENKFASEYIKKDSFVLTDSRDVFMYSRISKVPKPKSSSGGGSSTHRSSGGFSHGGGGGKF